MRRALTAAAIAASLVTGTFVGPHVVGAVGHSTKRSVAPPGQITIPLATAGVAVGRMFLNPQVVVPTTGTYDVSISVPVSWGTSHDAFAETSVLVNGTEVASVDDYFPGVSATQTTASASTEQINQLYQLSAGDVLAVEFCSNGGSGEIFYDYSSVSWGTATPLP
jgi:hypothetical protein